ncbi:sensor histidine kinase [Dactylosporangium sp. NPDC048998]|uniref:sensor histidine kinase n=1 Tax=Dactylosporangium sp. NPDC048998 TaxID=3363976 RepID=UPI003724B63C
MHRLTVPWGLAAALAGVGTVEILLDAQFSAAPAAPAAALAAVAGGMLLGAWRPVAGAVVVGLAFPIAVVGGLHGPTGAAVLGFFAAPAWAGYRVVRAGSSRNAASWPAPLALQLMASLGTWIAGRAAGSTVSGLGGQAWENLFFGLMCWGAWGVGLLARRLRDRADLLARLNTALDAEREARERAAVARERQRIARDMHDAVAHSISVMVLQLGAVRSTLPAGTPQAEMMEGIERLGRESVQEMRALVGIMRDTSPDISPGGAPEPTLARAEELVAEVRAAGLPVSLTVDGDLAGIPRAQDISAYRVLQEALTNVLRHAGPAPTTVCLRREPGRVSLTVDNESGVGTAGASPGGHGLIGMRERVAAFSGTLSAGARPGGYTVRAVFPLGTESGAVKGIRA